MTRRICTSSILHAIEDKELRYGKGYSCGGCDNLRLILGTLSIVQTRAIKDGGTASSDDSLKDPLNECFIR